MPNTWTRLAHGSLSGGAVSIGSIPQTYTDLALLITARDTNASVGTAQIRCRFNNDASALYSYTYMNNTGSAMGSARGTNDTVGFSAWINYGNTTASTFSNCLTYIPNYVGSAFKTWYWDAVSEYAVANIITDFMGGGVYRSTSAVSSIQLYPISSFDGNSTYTLYGIKNT